MDPRILMSRIPKHRLKFVIEETTPLLLGPATLKDLDMIHSQLDLVCVHLCDVD